MTSPLGYIAAGYRQVGFVVGDNYAGDTRIEPTRHPEGINICKESLDENREGVHHLRDGIGMFMETIVTLILHQADYIAGEVRRGTI
ncbi:MAG: hypothetical protein P8126_05540 [Gammaproteobacteria bacterium]|jgi:hypothetical protein